MKKKILIVIVAVAMMIPLLAVGVCADYSPETGWSEIGSALIPLRTYNIGTGDFSLSMFEGGWAFVIDDSAFEIDYGSVDNGTGLKSIVQFIGFIGFVVDSNYYLSDIVNEENLSYFVLDDPFLAVYNGSLGLGLSEGQHIPANLLYSNAYPNGFKVLLVPFTVEGSDLLPVVDYPPVSTMYNIIDPEKFSLVPFEALRFGEEASHPFLALIELMFDNFSRIIGGLAAGITGAFTALIWENPEATEKSLSTLAKFIFTIAGLSIGMAVFYLVLRLIRFGRQR